MTETLGYCLKGRCVSGVTAPPTSQAGCRYVVLAVGCGLGYGVPHGLADSQACPQTAPAQGRQSSTELTPKV